MPLWSAASNDNKNDYEIYPTLSVSIGLLATDALTIICFQSEYLVAIYKC